MAKEKEKTQDISAVKSYFDIEKMKNTPIYYPIDNSNPYPNMMNSAINMAHYEMQKKVDIMYYELQSVRKLVEELCWIVKQDIKVKKEAVSWVTESPTDEEKITELSKKVAELSKVKKLTKDWGKDKEIGLTTNADIMKESGLKFSSYDDFLKNLSAEQYNEKKKIEQDIINSMSLPGHIFSDKKTQDKNKNYIDASNVFSDIGSGEDYFKATYFGEPVTSTTSTSNNILTAQEIQNISTGQLGQENANKPQQPFYVFDKKTNSYDKTKEGQKNPDPEKYMWGPNGGWVEKPLFLKKDKHNWVSPYFDKSDEVDNKIEEAESLSRFDLMDFDE
jgi:hypothetical protein